MQEMQQIQQAFSSDLKCVQSELQRLQHGPHPTAVAQEQLGEQMQVRLQQAEAHNVATAAAQEQQGQQMKEMQEQMADVQRELQNLQH